MANTGNKIVITLKEEKNPGHVDTGNKKNNTPGDPNYIAPYLALTDCPLTYTMSCPTVLYTRSGTNLKYEFNLSNDIVKNPVIKKIKVSLDVGSFSKTYILPHTPSPNYFLDQFTSLGLGVDYDIIIEYLDQNDSVLHTCNVDVT